MNSATSTTRIIELIATTDLHVLEKTTYYS